MAFDRNEISGPRDLFTDNMSSMGIANEKNDLVAQTKIDLNGSFQKAAYASTPLSPDFIADAGMQQVINPQNAIDLEGPQQVMQMTADIDPQELNSRAQLTGISLEETKLGLQSNPKTDSIFSIACDTMSNEIRGIADSLSGGPQSMMDPRLQMQMQAYMTPRMGSML